jgi:hypothetical protein
MKPPNNENDEAWSITLKMIMGNGDGDFAVAMFIGETEQEAVDKAKEFLAKKKPGMYCPMPEPVKCKTFMSDYGLVWSVK